VRLLPPERGQGAGEEGVGDAVDRRQAAGGHGNQRVGVGGRRTHDPGGGARRRGLIDAALRAGEWASRARRSGQ